MPLLSHSLALDYQLPYYQRHSFHHLRHTAVHAVYEATRDLLLVQRFARHSSLLVTSVPPSHRRGPGAIGSEDPLLTVSPRFPDRGR